MADAIAVVLEFSDSLIACWPAHVLDDNSLHRSDAHHRVRTHEIGLAQDLPRRFVGREAFMLSSTGENCWVHCQTERVLVRRR